MDDEFDSALAATPIESAAVLVPAGRLLDRFGQRQSTIWRRAAASTARFKMFAKKSLALVHGRSRLRTTRLYITE
jgi:hypothetical protein